MRLVGSVVLLPLGAFVLGFTLLRIPAVSAFEHDEIKMIFVVRECNDMM